MDLPKAKETGDKALEVASEFKIKNDDLMIAHAKLVEDFEHLRNFSRVANGNLIWIPWYNHGSKGIIL